MSGASKIEWTDATWNPVTGCTKVSQGCKNCYAERLAPKVFAGQKFFDRIAGTRPRVFTDVVCHPERLDAPLHWRKPRRIFVNSMSDLFHEDVPDEFILKVFDVMRQSENGYASSLNRLAAQHIYQILTKRAARMLDFCERLRFDKQCFLADSPDARGFNLTSALKHVWLGVSVEDQATADERIPLLLQTPAAVRFISAEPLLAPIDLMRLRAPGVTWLDALSGREHFGLGTTAPGEPHLHWVIAGGESGPHARPSHPDWFRSLRDQCAAAACRFFFKQWGEWEPRAEWSGHQGGGRFEPMLAIMPDGSECPHDVAPQDVGAHRMAKVGKKAAGRLLDGREHNEYPA